MIEIKQAVLLLPRTAAVFLEETGNTSKQKLQRGLFCLPPSVRRGWTPPILRLLQSPGFAFGKDACPCQVAATHRMWTMRLLGRVLALTSWVTSLEGLLAAHPGAFGQRFLLGTRLAQCDANRSVPDKTNPFTSIAARFQMMRGGDSASPRVPRVPHIFATSLRAGAGASVEEDLIP
ncbi:unnamed protein product, partial [Heterosigma akashiwo]